MTESVWKDTLNKLHNAFGPKRAAQIEEWTSDVSHPQAILWMLAKPDLASHIRRMTYIFGSLADEPSEETIARIVVVANEAIASEIERLTNAGDAE